MQLIHQSKFNLQFTLPHQQGHMKLAIKYIYPAKVFDINFEYQYLSDEIGDINPGNLHLTY